ncbi:TetR/AcrR family transcriptional regulator [Peterkaempfera bronchialis]|uniref:TetR/AcrR family transcriptional regulator n=1 Tax=Peterkaempfera bronchialis TaxID=2126346 RepID=A0A345T334_9ACTN|nr:TetR/AcrR family transcriptional regulator [Peterkaempfera bronchialis]AXI80389.1 TetR/AcrR family transcriptional regulator [Peterkaempfera bronchialis]
MSDALPQAPWERARRPPTPARVPLTRDRIVDAAFTVLDREGLDGLSMRQVAAELQVAVSALYAHVSAKDELLELMYNRMFVGYELPEPDPERWQEQVKDFARQGRARLLAHRDMARISMAHVPFTSELLPHVEQFLAMFRTAGLPDRISAVAGDVLSTYLDGFTLEEGIWTDRMRQEEDGDGTASWQQRKSEMQQYFAALPQDRFPHLTALAHLMADETQDQRFELGLEIIVRGLASYLDEPRD